MPSKPKKSSTKKPKPSLTSTAAEPRGPVGKVGRPSVWTQELEDRILTHIESGMTDREACQTEGVDVTTLHRKRHADEKFRTAYAQARARRTEVFVDELISLCDESPKFTENGIDSAWVAYQKQRIDTRKFLLSKILPKEYGDKIGVEHSGQVGLKININLGER